MTIELDWQEGEEQPGVAWQQDPDPLPFAPTALQTIASGHPTRTRPSRRLLRIVLVLVLVTLIAGTVIAGVIYWRANQGSELARQDIQTMADTLVSAREDGDLGLIDSLVDDHDGIWKHHLLAELGRSDAPPPPTAIAVQAVRLSGDRASAEIEETQADGSTLRKLGFFRRGETGWRLSPPVPEFFGDEARTESPHFRVEYRERDEPWIGYAVNLAEGAFVSLCSELRCVAGGRPLVLRLQYASGSLEEPADQTLLVPSPWLTGIAQDGLPSLAFEQEVIRQLAQAMAAGKAPQATTALLKAVGTWAVDELVNPEEAAFETELLAHAVETGSLLGLEEAWHMVAILDSGDDPLVAAQVHSLLSFVQESTGGDGVGRLLEVSNVTQQLDELLRRALNVDARTFQHGWLNWLRMPPLPPPGTETG